MTIPQWIQPGDTFSATFHPFGDLVMYQKLFDWIEDNYSINAGTARVTFKDATWGKLSTDDVDVFRRGRHLWPRRRRKPSKRRNRLVPATSTKESS